jgi:hypothetical protein
MPEGLCYAIDEMTEIKLLVLTSPEPDHPQSFVADPCTDVRIINEVEPCKSASDTQSEAGRSIDNPYRIC